MQDGQAADFVYYYDAADAHWLILVPMVISTALVVLAVGAGIVRRMRR